MSNLKAHGLVFTLHCPFRRLLSCFFKMRTHLCALAVSSVLAVLAPSAVVAQVQCSNTFEPITAQEWNDGANPGWNIGNTLDATPDETSWGQPRVVNSTITNVKSAGFRGIRIPSQCQLHSVRWYIRLGIVSRKTSADIKQSPTRITLSAPPQTTPWTLHGWTV